LQFYGHHRGYEQHICGRHNFCCRASCILFKPQRSDCWFVGKTAVVDQVYYLRSSFCTNTHLRFGTAFAFLVQVCFANTAGTACVQWVWRRCSQQALSINRIDAAFAVDRNMFMLLIPKFVSKFPGAAGLALIFW
jgi:hypothetical protein